MSANQNDKSFLDLCFELVELVKRYLRQEIKSTVDNYIVGPIKKIGAWLALTIVAATLLALALIFLAVGAFQLLATLVGATWTAYLIIGVILFICAVILMMTRPGTR